MNDSVHSVKSEISGVRCISTMKVLMFSLVVFYCIIHSETSATPTTTGLFVQTEECCCFHCVTGTLERIFSGFLSG